MSRIDDEELQAKVDKIHVLYSQITSLIDQVDFIEVSIIPQDRLTNLLDGIRDEISTLINKLYEYGARKSNHAEVTFSIPSLSKYDFEIDKLRKLTESIRKFRRFISGPSVSLSNNPILVLTGEAGVGKSHLLADIACNRAKQGAYTLLLLGQQFATTEDPWTQIKKFLQLQCDRDTFLGALNAKAEASRARVLIFIDAINEGQGKNIWKDHILGFITALKRFPNVGLVLSLRTSYEQLLVPNTDYLGVTKIMHSGFSGYEYNASKLFFDHYQIKQPSIPLLHPEFSNPLFLKLFCQGLFKKGLNEIPIGYEGISNILNFYLDVVNEKISDKYNYPRKLSLAHKVLRRIAERIAETNNSYLSYEDAFSFIENLEVSRSILDKAQFFQDLISEGLLTENLYWDKGGSPIEGIYIAYERFSDHLVASYLLEKYLDQENPKKTFSDKGNKLGGVLSDWDSAEYNKGLIEALSIQLPEKISLELYEVAEHAKTFESVILGFIESIIWRRKETLSCKQMSYIDAMIRGTQYESDFIDKILLVASSPGHYFNGDFLHNVLTPLTMADRDAWWTQLIHNMYPGDSDTPTTLRRIIDWAWIDDIRKSLSDEAARLMGQSMMWFLASCNRMLRDATTKALICLLQERVHILINLMENFKDVNDPYVLQRIYAVAYGCAVRTSDTELLKSLGELVFELIFNTEEVVPDILLRDYARGIIEYAVFRGHRFELDLAQIRPPFKSDLPKSFPSNEEIDLLKIDDRSSLTQYLIGFDYIQKSMVTEYGRGRCAYGDFGRYVFERALSYWNVNVDGLSNLAVQWIIKKYGYDVQKHGCFDQSISYMGRHSHCVERIGKKYQWIAFHELLARVSDNYTFSYNQYGHNLNPRYNGPWEPFVRDIDPTITLRRNERKKAAKNWFSPLSYSNSNWEHSNRDWIRQTDDLLNPVDQVLVVDEDGVEWLVLEIYLEWTEPDPLISQDDDRPKKRLVYDLSSHIVHKEDFPRILDYLSSSSLLGCGLSESKTRYQMFSREYYWSAASQTFSSKYYGDKEWDDLYENRSGKHVCQVALTAIRYAWESEYDYSKNETISFYKPTELVFRLLNLQYTDIEGAFSNESGEIICFDPSVTYNTPKCLLVRKRELLEALEANNLDIIWNILGEKQAIGLSIKPQQWFGRLNVSSIVYFERGNLESTTCYEEESND
ncbi:MAG: ATP-binding protein [Porphyromonadaceae bacterium]|nr:ATP-binding protein [Porphyromonadaceae bacterium]